jgi:hypothetical protein
VGQPGAQVVQAAGVGGVGDQAGVVGGVGDGGHGGDQGVEEGGAADVVQFAGVLQLAEQGDGVGGVASVGQGVDRPPDDPVGGPVEVGLLHIGGDLDQQPPSLRDRAERGLFGFQVCAAALVARPGGQYRGQGPDEPGTGHAGSFSCRQRRSRRVRSVWVSPA